MNRWSGKVKDWDLDVPLRIKKLKLPDSKKFLNEQSKSGSDILADVNRLNPVEISEMSTGTTPKTNNNAVSKMNVINDYPSNSNSPQTQKYSKTYSRKMQKVFLESSEEIFSDELEDSPELLSAKKEAKSDCISEVVTPDFTEDFLFSDHYLDNSDFSEPFEIPNDSPLSNSASKIMNGGYQRTRKNLKQQIVECRKLDFNDVSKSTTVESGTLSPIASESKSRKPTAAKQINSLIHEDRSPLKIDKNGHTFNYKKSKTVHETRAPLFPDIKTKVSISKNILCETPTVNSVQSTSNNIPQSRNQPSLMDLVRRYSEDQSSLSIKQKVKKSPRARGTKRNSPNSPKNKRPSKKAKKNIPVEEVGLLAKAGIKSPVCVSGSNNYSSKNSTLAADLQAISLRIKGICDSSFNNGLKNMKNLLPKPVLPPNESAESDQDNQMAVLGLVKKETEKNCQTSGTNIQMRENGQLDGNKVSPSCSPKKGEIDVPKRKLMLKTGLRNRSLSTDEESDDISTHSLSNHASSPVMLNDRKLLDKLSERQLFQSSSLNYSRNETVPSLCHSHIGTSDTFRFQINATNSSTNGASSQSDSFHVGNNDPLEDRECFRHPVPTGDACTRTSTSATQASAFHPTCGSIVPFTNAQNCIVFPMIKSSHSCSYPVLVMKQECGCSYFNPSTSGCNLPRGVSEPCETRNVNMNTAIVSSVRSDSNYMFKGTSVPSNSEPCEISEFDYHVPETDTDTDYIAENRRTCKSQSADFFCTVLQKIRSVQNKCCFDCFEENRGFSATMPFSSKMSVRTFCDNPEVMNVLLEILEELPDFDRTASEVDYDFPSDFEDDPLCNIVKDYVDYFIRNFITGYLTNLKNSQRFSSNSVLKFVFDYMQPRECVIFSHLFAADNMLKIEELVARISVAALLVIFMEFRRRETVDS